jgi:hypothetical protein
MTTGNVYISNNNEVVEFKHAGTTPIATFSLPAGDAIGCAIDPNSGTLAVVFSDVGVAVFNQGSSPTVYNSLLEDVYCGYDNAGNLFVSGFDGSRYGLSELPRGANAFTNITVAQSVGEPGQIQSAQMAAAALQHLALLCALGGRMAMQRGSSAM